MADQEKIFSIKFQTEAQVKGISELQTRLVQLTKDRNDLNKKIRENVKLTQEEKTRLGQLQPELVATRNKLRDMEREVVKANDALKKNSGFVAGVKKGMLEAGNSIALYAAGFMALKKVISNVSEIVANFDQAQANLRATTGKTKEELAILTEQSKVLGGTTAFTATQVTEAQNELAKLGFTVSEITQLTPSVLDLAAATGTDLANASAIAGATVRGFGLEATDTQRVVDVMAASFTKSSLDIEKFSVAMANVAPVAKSAGFSIEETTAMLGILTDAGIDASKAGTGLRNVFLELTKKGITFDEAMEMINKSTNKNKTALELFGKESAVVGTVLAENRDKADNLTTALNDVGGAAERMANEQLNTLNGRLTIMTSAWEGFVLSIEEGSGPISNTISNIVGYFTDLLNVLTLWNEGEISFFSSLTKEEIDAKLKAREDRLAKQAEELAKKEALEKKNTKAVEENTQVEQENTDVKEKQIKKTTDLIKLKQEELKLIQDRDASSKEELIARNLEAAAIQQEIKELQNLGLEREKEIALIDIKSEKIQLETQREEQQLKLKNEAIHNAEMEAAMKSDKVKQQEAENYKYNEDLKKQAAIDTLNFVQENTNAVYGALADNLRAQRDAELASVGNNQAKIAEVNKRYAIKQQKLSATQALINGALAATSALATVQPTVPAGMLAALSVGVQTAIQVAAIKSQKFAKGGIANVGGVLQGKSHAQGGIPFAVGGRLGFEAEGGEAIINKKSTAMFGDVLSAINVAGGGKRFAYGGIANKYANGGLTPVATGTTKAQMLMQRGNDDLIKAIDSRIDRIKVLNVATETAGVANKVNNIQNEASF